MRRQLLMNVVIVLLAPAAAFPQGGACRPVSGGRSAAEWLTRARTAVGLARAGQRVLSFHAIQGENQDYESDRTYPPYFSSFQSVEGWLDPGSRVERYSARTTFQGVDAVAGPAVIENERTAVVIRDTISTPSPEVRGAALQARGLDPWAVLLDWSADAGVKVESRCPYRDYDRVVLARRGPFGEERLFLTEGAVPVKLDRIEPHYLWGQQHAEYLYSTWTLSDSTAFPGSAIRLADGQVITTRTYGAFHLTPRDSAPALALSAPDLPIKSPRFLQALPPDTLRISPTTVVLHNPGYNETITLARDTVFVFDATQSDDRARQDSTFIARFFPGRHPVVLVVTDLAWPHVSGVRFWVASGATIVSHRASREFLEQVVARRWTLAPDKLERTRGRAKLRFRPVSDSLSLAGGEITVHAIDGIGSEGALIAYVREARFLWASDYIQDLQNPTLYALEVWRAAARAGLAPERVDAEHIPITPWSKIHDLVGGLDVEGRAE